MRLMTGAMGRASARWLQKPREHIVAAAEVVAFERAAIRGVFGARRPLPWRARPQTRAARLIGRWQMMRADPDLAADELGVPRLADAEWAGLRRGDRRPP